MLGLDWTELALIAVVAVVVIGPKDLPEAVRGVAKGIQKLRRMAGEFQSQVDEVVREAKLEDVRNQINEIRSFDFRSAVEREIDKDGAIRKTFTEDPLREAFTDPVPAPGATVTPPPPHAEAPPAAPSAPAFVPPGVAAATPPPAPPPSFVPPQPAAGLAPASLPQAPAPSAAGTGSAA